MRKGEAKPEATEREYTQYGHKIIRAAVPTASHVAAFFIVRRKIYVLNTAADPAANLIRLDFDP